MPSRARPSRTLESQAQTEETLVDLLVAHLDEAYTTAGQPGALSAARAMFRRMGHDALAALAYDLELMEEPPVEGEREPRHEVEE